MTTVRNHQDRPDLTAALRHATWVFQHTGHGCTPAELQHAAREARQNLGLAPYQGGALRDARQRRTQRTKLQARHGQIVHNRPQENRLVPLGHGRFLNATDHGEIRRTACQGHLEAAGALEWHFTTRAAWLPALTLLAGPVQEVCRQVESTFPDRRGLYLLRRGGLNYAGQTGEFHVRGRSPAATGGEVVIFAFPAEHARIGTDTLKAAEPLPLASRSELLQLESSGLGADAAPDPEHLRAGAAFSLAFLAAVFRWTQHQPQAAQALLVWRTDVRGLAEAYLSLQPSEARP